MHKSISRLQYITSPSSKYSYFEQIKLFCLGGGNWVQLRMKEESIEEIEREAFRGLSYCRDHEVTFIINDHVELAAKIGADGVHLGKGDCSPLEARKILGEQAIIGGTANSFDDIKRLMAEGVDYIGLGPFRFTTTKKNLSPVLGIEGYQSILKSTREQSVKVPVVAIGGLVPEDLKGLFDAGVYGVAISSYLSEHEQLGAATLDLLTQIGRLSSQNWARFYK